MSSENVLMSFRSPDEIVAYLEANGCNVHPDTLGCDVLRQFGGGGELSRPMRDFELAFDVGEYPQLKKSELRYYKVVETLFLVKERVHRVLACSERDAKQIVLKGGESVIVEIGPLTVAYNEIGTARAVN